MPLPDSTPLVLHVAPGTVPAPKRAMVVRMSAETLDALDNGPPVFVDFARPGISIGDAFFPMRPQKESSPHELYLRAAPAARPLAPLKLYANVVGKFMVERQLGDKVTDKVRQQTMVAKQQHMERQAILLDQPPIPAPGRSAKRKVPGSGSVISKPLPLPQPTKASPDLRRRLVHFLATSPRLAEDVVKMVGGGNVTASARQDLLALLEDVAEQPPAKKGDASARPWSLKPQTWTEVRPFEWPKLPEADRISMARQARMAFKALKIPESDPAWDNVRYRATAPAVPAPTPMTATSSRSSASAQPEIKRPAIATKDARSKPRHDTPRAKGEIQMRDESTKATVPRVNAVKRQEMERPSSPTDSSAAAKTAAARRVPGSGYQKKTSLPSPDALEKSDARAPPRPALPTSLPPKPSPATSPAGASAARKTIPAKPTKREDESDRERDRDLERQKERERRERERELREKEKEKLREERERERLEMEKREKARQKERDAMEREKRLREKEREREEMEQEKRHREKERILKERAAASAVHTLQRKTAHMEDGLDDTSPKVPPPKRRKLDDGASVASSSSTARDPGSKKPAHEPSPVPRLKMKKDTLPQPSHERRGASSAASKSERSSKSGGSTKLRRRSPIYTSSEDEGEIPQPRKRNPSPPPVSDRSNSSDQPEVDRASRHHRTPRAAYPPAHDHAALRSLYQSQYSNYLGTFSKVVAQKRKIEAMLNGDSDAEPDMLDPDDLIKLSMEHKSLKTELENIHDIYTKGAIVAAE